MSAEKRRGLIKGVAAAYVMNGALSFFLFNSLLFSILTPLPQIFCHIRMGRWAGFSLPIILFIANSLTGFGSGVSYLVQFALPGILISEAIKRGFSIEKGFTIAVTATLAAALLTLSVVASDKGVTSEEAVSQFFEKMVTQSITFQKKEGGDKEALKEVEKLAPTVIEFMARIHHALIAISIMATLWLNILLLTMLMRNKEMPSPFGDLSKWKAPEKLVWGVVAGGVMLIAGSGTLQVAGISVLLLLFVIYFFQGMAIISFYFRKKKLSGPLKGMGYLFIIWYLGVLVAIMGLFDLWADFRRLSAPKEQGM